MQERIIRIVQQVKAGSYRFQIAETESRCGRQYVLNINGRPEYHSASLGQVQNYMDRYAERVM